MPSINLPEASGISKSNGAKKKNDTPNKGNKEVIDDLYDHVIEVYMCEIKFGSSTTLGDFQCIHYMNIWYNWSRMNKIVFLRVDDVQPHSN